MSTIRYLCTKSFDSKGRAKPCFMLDATWANAPEETTVDVIDSTETQMLADLNTTAEFHAIVQAIEGVALA